MVSTKAATFSSKIRNLNEFHNNIVNNSLAVNNSGTEVVLTLNYFSQELLTVLKNVTSNDISIEAALVDRESQSTASSYPNSGSAPDKETNIFATANRIKIFPTLNYATLYHSLLNLIDVIPSMQINQIAVGESLLKTFECLAPFLTDDLLESLPYTLALALTSFPKDLHKCIVDSLCNTILPIALYSDRATDTFTANSVPSIIMLVLQYGNDTAFNVQLFECLLSLKRNLIQDILCSIAYGSYKVRYHATNLLFRYWPRLNPNKSDRNIHYHVIPRKALYCHSEKCFERRNLAYKVCIDPNFSIHGDTYPPPFNLCNECCREIPKRYQVFSNNILNPVEFISHTCENKTCTSINRSAAVVCYSSPCIITNDNKPISFCAECHLVKHQKLFRSNEHIFQEYPENLWKLDVKTKSYLTISIINLLKEVSQFTSKQIESENRADMKSGLNSMLSHNSGDSNVFSRGANMPPIIQTAKGDLTNLIGVGLIGALNTNGFSNTSALASNLFASGSSSDESSFNKRLLSRYGCYLIISLIDPTEFTPDIETFGRIISMVLQWFHMVCYIPSDASGEIIAKLRTRFILPWIKTVTEKHFELVVSSFLPFPAEFTKVGGVWETKSNKSIQIKQEFTKFCDLITYEIVTFEMWDYAMPYWLDAIINDLDETDLGDFRSLFSKLFDPDMAPFSIEQLYNFISERFEGTSSVVQEQALSWIQILCELNVIVPLTLLLDMFQTGLNSLQKLESRAMRRREASQSLASTNEAAEIDNEQAHYQQMLAAGNSFTVFDTYDAYKVYRNQLMLQRMTGQELANLIKEEEEDFIINNSELNVTCCIMQLDMVLKQFDLQRPLKSLIFNGVVSRELFQMINKQLILPWIKRHKCKQQFGLMSPELASPILTSTASSSCYCAFCEDYVVWFTFAKEILTSILPKQEIDLPECNFHSLLELINVNETIRNARSSLPKETINAFGGALTDELLDLPCPPKTVETVTPVIQSPENPNYEDDEEEINNNSGENLDPKKTAEPAVSEPEIMVKEEVTVKPSQPKRTNPDAGIWVTSEGIYYFKLTQLAPQHQLFYSLLKELYRVPDVDAFYNLLISLKLLIMHGGCLETATKEQKGFLIFSLEKLYVPNLWRLLSAAYCHINNHAVPLLIHSLVYEAGQATFWSLVQKDFSDPSWKTRMQAISRVVAIAQNIDAKKLKNPNYQVFSSLAFAFSGLIHAMHDIEPVVAQKAISLMETLTTESLHAVIDCLQLQFDCVIADRPHLIHSFSLLYTNHKATLSWDFFCQRFNSLALEYQLSRGVTTPYDIYGYTEINNACLHRKINMAKFALKRSNIIRHISCEQPDPDTIASAQEIEKLNNEVLSSLITLLMKFMAFNEPSKHRNNLKHQTALLKHLEYLLRYNSSEMRFVSPPHVLRSLVPLNAFMAGLPLVMDKNLELGKIMLPTVLALLRYLPSPYPDLASQISLQASEWSEQIPPVFTIGLLDFQARYYWVQTLIVILYKYEYNIENSKLVASSIRYIVKIIINTLNCQHHKCDMTIIDQRHMNDQFRNSEFSLTDLNAALPGDSDSASLKSERVRMLSKHTIEMSRSNNLTNKRDLINGLNNAAVGQRASGRFMSRVRYLIRRCRKSRTRSLKVSKSSGLTHRNRIVRGFTILFRTKKKKNKWIKTKKSIKNNDFNQNTTEHTHGRKRSSHIFSNTVNSKLNNLYKQARGIRGPTSSDQHSSFLDEQSTDELVPVAELVGECERGLGYLTCQRCFCRIETYNEDTLGGLIVACSTLVHRDCQLAAPFILDMILAITRIAKKKMYSWQATSNFFLPGNYTSISRQFLRCTLHQLQNNEIFYQLFQSDLDEPGLLETISLALHDFNELSSVAALKQTIIDLNMQKNLQLDVCMRVLGNISIYMEYMPLEQQQAQWTLVVVELETLFRSMQLILHRSADYTCLFRIIVILLRINYTISCKQILEPFSRILCFILQHCSFKLSNLVDICSLSNRAFGKDRAKQYLAKCIINELVHSINVKVCCLDRNLLQILQLAVLDSGGNIYQSTIIEDEHELYDPYYYIQTNAADSLKQHINDIIAFIASIHTINRVKRDLKLDKTLQTSSTDDSLGAELKAGLAQFLALEFTELNKSKDRDSRSIVKYLPWLSNLPTNHQNGAKEFVDCIDHIRFLSWILIGSLTHSALTRNKGTVISYPIPINCGHYIGEHIFYVLNGFAEHSKTSAIHMSSLFHSFILCQLWTMYCEQIHVTFDTENESSALNAIMEFWSKITPGILQLLSQTKVLTDMVTLHFLSLIEGLQQYNSLVLAKFFPMWVPVLFMTQLQGDQLKRAKHCLNYQPPAEIQLNISSNYGMLLKCLQRLQYKIAMIEQQSSNAAMLYN